MVDLSQRLRLRRQQWPATTNAGRCRLKHLAQGSAGQHRPKTPPLLPNLLPRSPSRHGAAAELLDVSAG